MKQALILFTRVPIAGKTKTRLQTALTPEQCAQAHSAFCRMLRHPVCHQNSGICWCFMGRKDRCLFYKSCCHSRKISFAAGKNTWRKMDRAITDTFKMGYDRCVLIGADLPLINREIIAQAMRALEEISLVLGPTVDGGYYLVGSTKPCPEIFSGQSYGGSNVFENTVAAAQKQV